jgi:hypothetical protein
MPWWEYIILAPFIAIALALGLAVGLAAAFAEACLMNGEHPRDRWMRLKFTAMGIWHVNIRPFLHRRPKS